MSLSDELHRLLEAIAKANGHSHPAEWAAAVKEHFAASEAPPEQPAEPQSAEGKE